VLLANGADAPDNILSRKEKSPWKQGPFAKNCGRLLGVATWLASGGCSQVVAVQQEAKT